MASCLRSLLAASASLAVLIPATALAQGGPDASGYVWSPGTYDFVVLDPGNGGLGVPVLSITGTSWEADVALPWAGGFPFYGNTYNTISVTEEGAIVMGPGGSVFETNGAFPDTSSQSPDIAVFWDGLDSYNTGAGTPIGGAYTYYDAGNDRFIVSWEGIADNVDTGDSAFQVHLYGDGSISMHYADTTFGTTSDNGLSATVGIQDFTGGTAGSGNALNVLFNTASIVDGVTAYSFTQCVDVDVDGAFAVSCGGTDCDDNNPNVYPGQTEVCSDGIDNNCSGFDQPLDIDLDGFVSPACGGNDCDDLDAAIFPGNDVDADGSDSCSDCDDNDPTSYPGAPELCDGLDNDCGGLGRIGGTGNNSFGPGTNRSRGGIFLATASATVSAVGYTADVPVGETLTFGVYESTGSNGPWTLLATSTHVSTATGLTDRVSGPISVGLTSGNYYAVGAFWTANVAYGYLSPSQMPEVGPFATLVQGVGSSFGGSDSAPGASYASLSTSSNQYAVQMYSDAASELLDSDGDGVAACLGDCDDNNALINPTAIEFCGDGLDNDCDGTAENIDADLDGESPLNCGGTDCNDGDGLINSLALETCNGVDEDCDGLADEQDSSIGTITNPPTIVSDLPSLFFDETADVTTTLTVSGSTAPVLDVNVNVDISHTWAGDVTLTLTSPTGTSVTLVEERGGSNDNFTNTTFDDEAGTPISAGSAPFTGSFVPETPLAALIGEAADGVWSLTMSDCCFGDDGLLNNWALTIETGVSSDADGDGWIASSFCAGGDCDDANGGVSPGTPEVCGDGIDQDCDTLDLLDDIDLDTFSSVACGGDDCDDNNPNIFAGSDFDVDGAFACQDDCNDNDATINPTAAEICNDGIDQDCDGVDAGIGAIDNDLDGETNCTDCNDNNPSINSLATEVCGDGVDNDCSGTADDLDADLDLEVDVACGGTDCDDSDPATNAAAAEICDALGADNDCDGIADAQDFDLGPPPTVNPTETVAGVILNGVIPTTVATITEELVTSSPGILSDVNVSIDITHTWDSDLDITLISPAGTRIDLTSDNGGSADNYTGTTFDDEGVDGPITAGSAPFTGSFQPEQPLSTLDGEIANGTWTLEIADDAGGDGGQLNSWSVTIESFSSTADGDGDGYISSVFCAGADCDDDPTINPDAATINPGATEVCGDGIDQDCLAGDLVADVDLDGFSSILCGGDDCDDGDSLTYVGAPEVCGDAIDNDCDPTTLDVVDADNDGADCVADCDDSNPLAYPGFFEICDDGADNDCDNLTPDIGDADGDGDLCDVDCDDTSPTFGPSQPELLCSGADEDCDAGLVTPDIDDGDLDGFLCNVDCLDTNAAVNPAAVEVACDGLDNDCDPSTEGEVDLDLDGSTCGFDCDDDEPLAYPGNAEACNDSIDNDCDPSTVDAFDLDLDGVTCITDCDDNDPLSFPGAPEICGDGIDQDCDFTADEPANDAYDLSDDDAVLIGLCNFSFPFCGTDWSEINVSSNGRLMFGFSSGQHTESSAVFLAQTPEIAVFWNDLNPAAGGTIEVEEVADTGAGASLVVTYTDVPELGVAGSANSATLTLFDDGTASIVYGDLSMGDGLVGFSCGSAGDIIETDLSEYELAPNAWAIGQGTESAVYELFSGTNPNDLDNASLDFCLSGGDDSDGDGWTDLCGDCDDAAAGVYPGSPDICGDGIDQDCDGTADNADLDGDGEIDVACGGVDCDDTDELVNTSGTEICNGIDDDCSGAPETGGEDSDNDGFLICDGDCDDSNADINPDASEVCDQVDNDCDGALDNGFTPDFDNDGQVSSNCGGEDCDDTNDDVYVGADEICDLEDNDCNGEIDEIDVDADGFIDGNCNGDDCNDNDASVNPGATEVPYDGIDNDCSGGDVVDADGDGFFGGEGGNDCNDNDAAINPDAEEICDDTIDNNCDGGADKGDKDNDIAADAVCSACNCSSSVVDGEAPTGTAMLLLGLAGLMGLRRRRE
jgi:MYXO-CTERM domain-containing protein